jgi:hypothetical protein
MPRSGNGIGTVHFGRSQEREDGSYVTTTWFALLYLPICPIRSERILPLSFFDNGAGQMGMRFSVLSREPLDGRRVWIVYAVGWSVLAWYVSLIFVYDFVARFLGGGPWMIIGWFVFPFLLLFAWQKFFVPPPKFRPKEVSPGSDFSVYRRSEGPNEKKG